VSSRIVSSDALAAALTPRLQAVAPPGIGVEVVGAYEGLGFTLSDEKTDDLVGTNIVDSDYPPGGIPLDEVVFDLLELLHHFQDFVVRRRRGAWPSSSNAHFPHRVLALAHRDEDPPRPGARLDHAYVRMWYGDRDGPTLALAPIPLAEILR
jgi:hypothetical protein